MFLQDGHNSPDVFCNVDRLRPSQDVTDILKRYKVHIVKLGHKAFLVEEPGFKNVKN